MSLKDKQKGNDLLNIVKYVKEICFTQYESLCECSIGMLYISKSKIELLNQTSESTNVLFQTRTLFTLKLQIEVVAFTAFYNNLVVDVCNVRNIRSN